MTVSLKKKKEEPKHIKAEDSTDFKVTCGKTGVALCIYYLTAIFSCAAQRQLMLKKSPTSVLRH